VFIGNIPFLRIVASSSFRISAWVLILFFCYDMSWSLTKIPCSIICSFSCRNSSFHLSMMSNSSKRLGSILNFTKSCWILSSKLWSLMRIFFRSSFRLRIRETYFIESIFFRKLLSLWHILHFCRFLRKKAMTGFSYSKNMPSCYQRLKSDEDVCFSGLGRFF